MIDAIPHFGDCDVEKIPLINCYKWNFYLMNCSFKK